jgi:hypothetical protein
MVEEAALLTLLELSLRPVVLVAAVMQKIIKLGQMEIRQQLRHLKETMAELEPC